MRFISAITAALFGATALAAPATDIARADPTVYRILDFTTRKYDGTNVATVFFNISATNAGTLNFRCIPYDPLTNTAVQQFESGQTYSCGQNSFFKFNYKVSSTKLVLKQDIAPGNTITGKIKTGEPICRAGGSSATDLVCTIPDLVKLDVTMT